ncbi:MAG: hypothetical protein HOG71_00330 [Bacteroidetes bacterium]|jgi:hypothetical protein|nr:hypothetical protein [Bacteroidota bacterium]MBT5989276.1 hypothetical protein [Bacteroidota bacterium]
MKKAFIYIFLVLFCTGSVFGGDTVDEKNINYCMGVFTYSMNYFMLQNNEGAAKIMALQSTRAAVSLMSMVYKNGKALRSDLDRFSSERQKAKVYLDKHINKIGNEIDNCILITNRIVKIQESKGIIMFGKSFQGLIREMNIELLKTYGLIK